MKAVARAQSSTGGASDGADRDIDRRETTSARSGPSGRADLNCEQSTHKNTDFGGNRYLSEQASHDSTWPRPGRVLRSLDQLVELASQSPFLHGLSDDDVRDLLRVSAIMRCHRGDVLIRPGGVERTLFVILEGIAEVAGQGENGLYPLATLGPGDIAGELSFLHGCPRTAWVTALTGLDVLMFTPVALDKTMTEIPLVASRLLYNLALILSQRLEASTTDILALAS
ncbi:MAG: cyclic nucleotide-binding domain-containing protein [Proteobacteria bacterium]|nr:cyclic nucleotide-binding domain-containing protein [Pseudomonadota bacterium]